MIGKYEYRNVMVLDYIHLYATIVINYNFLLFFF